jgi:TrmH family RNA methyltransferase
MFPANVRIVLVEPEYPGNVGSTARAMQTMGLSDLVIVAPACDPHSDETYMLAHSAADVVRNLRRVSSLEEALADTVFSVGTTRRTRRVGYPIATPEEAAHQICKRGAEQIMAIVFGRESSGLTNPELAACSIQSTIPCATENHSLNLAQAVQIYCYTLYQASLTTDQREYRWKLATHVEMEHFYAHLTETLLRLKTRPATTMENYLARFRRVLSRTPLETRDVQLLHKLLRRIDAGIPASPPTHVTRRPDGLPIEGDVPPRS